MYFCAAFVHNICETVTFEERNTINDGLSWWSRVIQKNLPCKGGLIRDLKYHNYL